jgi:hypothetical protein
MSDVKRYAAVSRVGHPVEPPAQTALIITDRDEAIIRSALGVYREFVETQVADAGDNAQLVKLWAPVLPQIDAVTAKLDGE